MNPVERPYIFISIPRCASSTVHHLLGLTRPKDHSEVTDPGIADNHATCDVVAERYGQSEFNRRFKFAFVRNPWDRCVSWYSFHKALEPYRTLTFREWVRQRMPHHWVEQNGTRYGDHSPLEQFRFICDAKGATIVDFVGRVECFRRDMGRVANVIGLKLPPREPRINRSVARRLDDYHPYYDPPTAERIGELLATDVRMFDYRY
jgi:hypothetical protein